MESVWWLVAELYKKGLLYKGYTIQPYSPKAGTGLSSHELNQPGCYKDVKDTSVVAQFKVNDHHYDDSVLGGDLHKIKTDVITSAKYDARTIIPKSIIDKYEQCNFWKG